MSAADWTSIEVPQDIRLVVADMDGTLLDEHSEIPQGFWPMLARLRSRCDSLDHRHGERFCRGW